MPPAPPLPCPDHAPVLHTDLQDADDPTVSKRQMEAAIRQLQGSTTGDELVAIINAFDVPKISYDPVSKRLYADTKWQPTMLPSAQCKMRLYSDRLALLYQRLRRNKRFQPQAQSGGDSGVSCRMGDADAGMSRCECAGA